MYSHDVVILGGGAGGLTAASGCAQLGLKTALVEKERLGGDCLYYGCVPSKTLIKSARVLRYAQDFEKFGLPKLTVPKVQIDRVLGHVREVIEQVAVHDSPERFRGLGAEIFFDVPEFISPHEVRLPGGRVLSARTIILATGSAPLSLPIPGLEEAGYITNIEIFSLKKQPRSMLTIGAGPIGVELSQSFLRLGTKVSIIDMAPRILSREDADLADIVKEKLLQEGAELYLGANIQRVEKFGGKKRLILKNAEGREEVLEAEEILMAVGRQGNTGDLKLEEAEVEVEGSFVKVGPNLSSSRKHILAVGDCNGKFLFTHVAGAEGSLAVRKTVLRIPVKMNYHYIPWVTYTDPEIASIGYNEMRAKEAGVQYTVVSSEFKQIDRAMAETETDGKIKILIDKRSRVIGTQIAGPHAGDLLIPLIYAVRNRSKLMDMITPIFPYPVLSEVLKKAGGNYFAPMVYNPRVKKILRTVFGYRGG